MKRFLATGIVLMLVLSAVPFAASAQAPAEVWVGNESMGELNFPSIQEAVDAVAEGGTVYVAAGEYVEQVLINKDLTLIGEEGAIIKAPAAPEKYTVPEDTKTWEPVIFAFGGIMTDNHVSGGGQINVTIAGFTIDGDGRQPANRSCGVFLRNVSGAVIENTIDNLNLTKETFGIVVYGSGNVLIQANSVSGFGRGGIVVGSRGDFPKPYAVVFDNYVRTVTHASWAQNGIQIGWGATGQIIGNTVSGHVWADEGWGASGILIPGSSNILVAGNEVSNNDYGVAVAGYGNYGGHYPASNIVIRDNLLYGNTYSGVCLQGDVSDTLIEGNTIHSNANGIDVYDYDPGGWTGGGVPVNNTASGNKIYNNEKGIVVWPLLEANQPGPAGTTFTAAGNWWGSAAEPADQVEGDVVYCPWALDEGFTAFATRRVVDDASAPIDLHQEVNYIEVDGNKLDSDDVLVFYGDGMRLDFPVALLPAGSVEIVIAKGSGPAPQGFKLYNLYSLSMSADGQAVTDFAGSFTLTFWYDPDEVENPDNLAIYWFDGQQWIAQASAVDTSHNRVTAAIDHFSDFALMETDDANPGAGGDELPKTGTFILWLLPAGLAVLVLGFLVLRHEITVW